MREKLLAYYEKEYNEAERILMQENRPGWVIPEEVVYNTINRLLGATQFALDCGLGLYSEVSQEYEFYYDKLKKLLDK